MSYEDGWAALNLEMPPRVPRTEYSVQGHWPLIREVTGLDVSAESDEETRLAARQAFWRAWNFDLHWSILISSGEFGERRTRMGHAAYADGGVDYSAEVSELFSEPEEALTFDPMDAYGTIDIAETARRFEEHYAKRVAVDPDAVNMTGVYITLISGLIEIFGWEMLLLMAGVDPDAFGRLADRYADWIGQYFTAIAEADVPAVMIHDDIVWTEGPFLPPEWYRKHVFPHHKRFMQPIRESGKKILFTSDGNYTMFIDDIVACGPHALVMEPTTDMALVAETYGDRIAFVGNADTRILLSGTKEQIRAEVQRCMDIGKSCPGFIMAVGNHIPANTPVENALYYNEVYEELSKR